jgi:hypothetical protein
MIDMSGRVVWMDELGQLPQGEHTATLAAHDLADGLYTVELRTIGEHLWTKVIVAR